MAFDWSSVLVGFMLGLLCGGAAIVLGFYASGGTRRQETYADVLEECRQWKRQWIEAQVANQAKVRR